MRPRDGHGRCTITPASLGLDCFTINLNLEDSGALTDREASGHAKRKLKSKVGEDEEALKTGVCYEPIDYEWMFEVLGPCIRNRWGAHSANRETVEWVRGNYLSRIRGTGCEIRKASKIG